MWLWTGAVYHRLHFAAVNPVARLFAAAFLLQGLLFLAAAASATSRSPMDNRRGGWRRNFGLFLVAYAAVLHPLLARGRVSAWLLAVPALWEVVGGSAAVLVAVLQDWLLLAGGIAATVVLLRGGRARHEPKASPGPAGPPRRA